ncbi:FAD-binding protein [Pseudomonas aeruginosa]|nr:FAD-binding protein [Pseudomonas aeruginosa]MDV6713445.1 FAD-binding protein [Pseudomonas aeruginosa]
MLGSAFWLTLATLLGLCLGFAREWLLVASWGAGERSDAFLIALFLPEALRMSLAGGVLSAAALPLFLERQGERRLDWLAAILPALLGIAVALSLLLLAAAPWLVRLLGPGLAETASAQAAANLRILAWCVPGLMLHALFSIPLQAAERFVLAGLGSLLFNLPPVLYLALHGQASQPEQLALACLLGSLLMPLVLLPSLWIEGWRPWHWRLSGTELGERYDAARIDAFLEACPHMVAFFERHTHLRFVDGNGIPDMHGDTPGAAEGGHQLVAAPYDARQLGPLLPRLRKTLRETSFMGMPIMAGADLAAFLDLTRSLPAFLHVARRFSSHLWHLLRYGRAMHLVNGVALVARLAKSAEALGVRLIESAPARELLLRDGKVVGALVESAEGLLRIEAGAVVLACGGFPHDPQRRAELAPTLDTLLPLPPPGCNGDGLRLGESAGGRVADDLRSPIAWAPVSRVPHGDGETGHFPHIIERGKPGVIGVLANGRRFVNEAHGYHDYVAALLEATPPGQPARSWLVCDRRFLRRYGLGYVRPAPLPIAAHLRSGYLKRGTSLDQLARSCGIDPSGLAATVAEYNRHAREGRDPEFGRGGTAFNRKQGDPAYPGPNPCVAPIERGPYYAVQVEPGCFGTFAGLKTDAQARVLDGGGQPIPGLYAAGADMASLFAGHYPSGGINLGPALTFGYIAGRHIAGALGYEQEQAQRG